MQSGRSGALMERQMTEAATLTNEELAILCDIVAGWSVKHSENLNADKRLDHPAALARARKVAARLRKKSFGREIGGRACRFRRSRRTCSDSAPGVVAVPRYC